MADDSATPPAPPAATDPAPAPSDATTPAATTLLTQGETPPADPAAKPATPPAEPPKAAPVVPEKYDFATVKLPEGVKLEGAIVDAVSPVFKELGLSQEQAAKLVSTHAEAMHKHAIEAEKAAETAFQKEMSDRATANIAAIKTEWGNDFDANLKIAQRGLARLFPGTEGKSLLDQTGLGNHPEFLKAFLAAGRMFQEDKPPNGTLPSGARKSDAEVFYGSSAN